MNQEEQATPAIPTDETNAEALREEPPSSARGIGAEPIDDEPWRGNLSRGESGVDYSKYSKTVREVVEIFAAEGVPRSERTISRFCEDKSLDCKLGDSRVGGKYVISPESIDIKIEELKQLIPSALDSVQNEPAISRDGEGRNGREPANEAEQKDLGERIATLEAENFGLKVSNEAKDQMLAMAKEERVSFIDRLQEQAVKIGSLNERLQLGPGRHDVNRDSSESD